MLQQGFIQVYTGNGKGKTTAALGLAMRASGKGLRVEIVQFMKADPDYGELATVGLLPGVRLQQFGRPDHVEPHHPRPEDCDAARQALAAAAAAMHGNADLIILDEVLPAVAWGLLPEAAVLELLARKPATTEMVLTGRYAPEGIVARADLVTEMVERKHYYQEGILAREGIEH